MGSFSSVYPMLTFLESASGHTEKGEEPVMFLFETPEGWFVAVFVVVMFALSISWISFARLSMARIEKQMKRDGITRPSAWDGIGLRVLWYAYAIVLPVGIWNRADDPFIDVPTVRRYATTFDRKLGLIFMISGKLAVLTVFIGAIFELY